MEQRDMKTVFVLDRNGKFVEKCNETFDFTIREGPKQKQLKIAKTIWTWCLEGLFEIHRILSDVYPRGTLQLRFAVADCMGKMLDTKWEEEFLTRADLAKLIEEVKIPSPTSTDISPIGGLTMAIEALAVETPEQKKFNEAIKKNKHKRTARNSELKRTVRELKGEEPLPQITNNGNLIMYTRLKNDEEMEKLQEEIVNLVISRNKIAKSPSNETFCPITSLRLFIVNYYAEGETCTVKTHPLTEHPRLSLLSVWVISRKATDMADAIHSLLMAAFDMGSTTVTKIPMKEDNRGSSNYDVELFHSGKVQTYLKDAKLIDISSNKANSDKGVTYDTMRLAWTTAPKTKWSLFPYHGEASPCTTAQAYSRPSACLTQFVRDGRCVMLDLEKKSVHGMNMPGKLVSHILIANRGRIFIQEIDFIQKKFSKKNHRGALMSPDSFDDNEEDINMEQLKHVYKQMELKVVAKNRLKDDLSPEQKNRWDALRHADIEKKFLEISRNIPMYAHDTFIFQENVRPVFEPIISIITQETITEENFEQCNKVILKLLQIRNNEELLVDEEEDHIGDCPVEDMDDPEEQMRVALVELAKHMIKYVKVSSMHEKVYKTFMSTMDVDQLLKLNVEDNDSVDQKLAVFPFFGRIDDQIPKEEKKLSPLERFLKKRRCDKSPGLEKMVFKKTKKIEEVADEETKLVVAKEIKIDVFANMCEMIERKEAKIRREFVGRDQYDNKANLYPQLLEQRSLSPGPLSTTVVDRNERVRNADRGGSGTPPPGRRY